MPQFVETFKGCRGWTKGPTRGHKGPARDYVRDYVGVHCLPLVFLGHVETDRKKERVKAKETERFCML